MSASRPPGQKPPPRLVAGRPQACGRAQGRGLVQPLKVGPPQPGKQPEAPPVYRPQPSSRPVQPKKSGVVQPSPALQPRRAPTAPPAYRPQPVPKVLQTKAHPHQRRPANTPTPPPVYRPGPTPAVLQAKAAGADGLAHNPSARAGQAAPPVYRPNPVPRVLQLKSAAPQRPAPQTRPTPRGAPPAPGKGPTHPAPHGATAPAARGRSGSVIQGMLVGPSDSGEYHVDWEPNVKYKRMPDTKYFYREKITVKHIARDDEWDEVERDEAITTRKFYHYNPKADMFKPCPPPPPPRLSPTISNEQDSVPKVIPPLVIGPQLGWELDQMFVQNSSLGRLPDNVSGTLGMAEVVKYVGGQVGVYFVETMSGTLVVKPLLTPCREYFGAQLCASLGITHPDTRLVTVESLEGQALLKLVSSSELFKKNTPFLPKYFMIMTHVKGLTLNEAKKEPEKVRSLIGEPVWLKKVVDDVTYIAALDFLLYYRDRSTVLGGGNRSNIMLEVRNKQIVGAVGIDQSVTLENTGLSVCFYQMPPIEMIAKIMKGVAKDATDIGEKLWKGLPKTIRAMVAEELLGGDAEQGPALMLQGFKKGLKLLSYRLNEQRIEAIHSELRGHYTEHDLVDPEKLKTAYNTIKKYSSAL